MKWKVWIKVCNDDKWYTNNKDWDTEATAIEHARDKFRGWTQAESWIVLQSGLDANNDSPTKS